MRAPALLLGAALALGGCAGLPELGGAMRQAAREPLTWGPLAAGAALAVTGADQEVSDWARRETPLFGSTQGAIDASDDLMRLTEAGWVMATLAAPAADDDPVVAKLADLGIGYLAVVGTGAATDAFKDLGVRSRPDGSDDRSFPSGHASRTGVTATLGMAMAHRRYDAGGARTALDTAFLTAAFATGWARVEAGKHYPSDVLAGYALGRFIGRTTELAFLDPADPVAVFASPDGVAISVRW